MSELSGQLLSTRIQQLADDAAGHTIESSVYELIDNELDIGSSNIYLLLSRENLCWAIFGDGPGAKNIETLWGCGKGLKIKSNEKIGNKISGELASAIYLKPNRLMYFSRNNDEESRNHQQLNADIKEMIDVVRTPDIDLSDANDKILYGNGNVGNKKLVRKPEPDDDIFDLSNVTQVKRWFKNNTIITDWFESEETGFLKVFKYEQDNTYKFEDFEEQIGEIVNKMEFLTYNTMKGFLTKSFGFIDVDTNSIRIVNNETCRKNFILGKNAILSDNITMTVEDDISVSSIDNNEFGKFSNSVLYIENNVYEKDDKIYSSCRIKNYRDIETFWVFDEPIQGTKENKVYPKHFETSNPQKYNQLKSNIFKDANITGSFIIAVSYLSKTEAEYQKENFMKDMNLEYLRQCYFGSNGRFLSGDRMSSSLSGIQERGLPHFRIVINCNNQSRRLLGIRAQKSSISLKTCNKIILETLECIVKPILNYNKNEERALLIENGVSDWNLTQHKNNVLEALKIKMSTTTTSSSSSQSTPSQVQQQPRPVQQQFSTTPIIYTPNPAPPIPRGPTTVLSSLDKKQTLSQLLRIKTKLMTPANPYKTKGDRSKLFTKLSNIEKEIILDDDILEEKIDYLIELVQQSSKQGSVKHAAELQEI
jgi:hypothetical protein